VITYHSREIENILLLLLSCYYHMECKYIWIIIEDRAGLYLDWIWTWLATERTQVAIVLPVSIENHPLLWMVVRSQTYYPEHILAYESGKTYYSLVMGSDSFWTDYYGWRFKHRTEAGPLVLGLGVLVWTGTWTGLVLFMPGV
jgi:hypothetical protein